MVAFLYLFMHKSFVKGGALGEWDMTLTVPIPKSQDYTMFQSKKVDFDLFLLLHIYECYKIKFKLNY